MQSFTHSSRKTGHHTLWWDIYSSRHRVIKNRELDTRYMKYTYIYIYIYIYVCIYIYIYIAAVWMHQQGIRGNRTTWGNLIHISQFMWWTSIHKYKVIWKLQLYSKDYINMPAFHHIKWSPISYIICQLKSNSWLQSMPTVSILVYFR